MPVASPEGSETSAIVRPPASSKRRKRPVGSRTPIASSFKTEVLARLETAGELHSVCCVQGSNSSNLDVSAGVDGLADEHLSPDGGKANRGGGSGRGGDRSNDDAGGLHGPPGHPQAAEDVRSIVGFVGDGGQRRRGAGAQQLPVGGARSTMSCPCPRKFAGAAIWGEAGGRCIDTTNSSSPKTSLPSGMFFLPTTSGR